MLALGATPVAPIKAHSRRRLMAVFHRRQQATARRTYGRHWHRVQRYVSRLLDPSFGSGLDRMDAHDCYEDEVFITLIPVHHLKDWLPEAIRQQANDHIDAHESLQICADLANAAKHAWLNPKKGGKRARVDVGPGAPLIHLTVTLADWLKTLDVRITLPVSPA
jgi:hypothetical protein